jgi:hypothetical protein
MKYLINIIFLLVAFNAFAAKDIVAIVNDKPITMYEFTTRKKMMITLNKIDISNPETERQLDKDILNILIEEELLNQHLDKVGGTISKEEIDNAVSMIEQKNKMPKGYLVDYMKQLGVSIESFRKQIKGELIKYNIVGSLSNSVSISPKELDVAVINSGFEDYNIEAWVFTSFDNQEKTLNAMTKLKKQLSSCAKVQDKAYSSFADGEKFDRKLKNLEDKTKSVVLDTKEGSSSNIYQEDGKFKMVLVCAKKASVSGDDVNKVKHFLSNQKMSQKASKFFKDLKAKAYIKILM